jgi:hypothetical protein
MAGGILDAANYCRQTIVWNYAGRFLDNYTSISVTWDAYMPGQGARGGAVG